MAIRLLTFFLLGVIHLSYGQKDSVGFPFRIIQNLKQASYKIGDTLSFTVKNVDTTSRGYFVEAICLGENLEKLDGYSSEIYTAFFNSDSVFLKRLKATYKANGRLVILPPHNAGPYYFVSPGHTSTFSFILTGRVDKQGLNVKFRLVPDISEEEPKKLTETRVFRIFAAPA